MDSTVHLQTLAIFLAFTEPTKNGLLAFNSDEIIPIYINVWRRGPYSICDAAFRVVGNLGLGGPFPPATAKIQVKLIM